MLEITNTLTGNKEIFKPHHYNKVSMYVCGITPYDVAHLGHGRVYVTFDLVYRLLTFKEYAVSYCRNFTDIDDKLINKAAKELGDGARYGEIAQKFIDLYHQDMQALNCLPPTYQPRVTGTIPEIITFIEKLIAHDKAYAIDGDVYFSIDAFPTYGALSKHKLADLHAGARVEPNEKKKNPLDFALWKSEKSGTFFESPWGWGRPGWHIECSAMALAYLGSVIDIHGGGLDLVFPHHENEIAQSESLTNAPFVHYWMHNGFVRINQEKMSKSLGNFFSLRDIFQKFPPMVIRFYYLNHHYRSPLEFSCDDLEALQRSYKKLCRLFEMVSTHGLTKNDMALSPTVTRMLEHLDDDFNTPAAWGVLFEYLKSKTDDSLELSRIKLFLTSIFGLTLEPLPEVELEVTPEIAALLEARQKARDEKNWAQADVLRDQLIKMGYVIKDKKL